MKLERQVGVGFTKREDSFSKRDTEKTQED